MVGSVQWGPGACLPATQVMDKARLDQRCLTAARGSNQCYERTVCYLGHELMGQVFTARRNRRRPSLERPADLCKGFHLKYPPALPRTRRIRPDLVGQAYGQRLGLDPQFIREDEPALLILAQSNRALP